MAKPFTFFCSAYMCVKLREELLRPPADTTAPRQTGCICLPPQSDVCGPARHDYPEDSMYCICNDSSWTHSLYVAPRSVRIPNLTVASDSFKYLSEKFCLLVVFVCALDAELHKR